MQLLLAIRTRTVELGAQLQRKGLSFWIKMLHNWGITLVLLALIGGPLVFFVWGSMWTTVPGLGGEFTTDGYRQLFRQGIYDTIWNTLLIAVFGTALALFFGISATLLSIKIDVPGARFIGLVLIFQYLLPGFLLALGWQRLFGPDSPMEFLFVDLLGMGAPSVYSLWGIALVGGLHYSGLVYLLSSGAIRSIPAEIEEAGKIGGASMLSIFRGITLPLVFPSLAIAGVLIFSRFIQSFGIPLILGFPEQIFVLATHMYYALRGSFPPNFAFASALGMVMLAITLTGLVVQRRMTGSREKYETIVGGGESRTSLRFTISRGKRAITVVLLAYVVVFYVVPLAMLVLTSFQRPYMGMDDLHLNWSLFNYETLVVGQRSGAFVRAFSNSLIISGVGAFIGMVLSSMASYVIVKSDSPLGDFLDFLTLSPAAIPGTIVGVAFLWIFLTYNFLGLYGTIWIIMLALSSRFIVYGTRATNSSFRSIGHELEEAAQVSGANFFSIFREVFVPLIRPGFVAGYVLLFVDYMKVLAIPVFLGAPGNIVIPALLWQYNSTYPEIAAAVATIFMLMIALIYFTVDAFTDIDITEI